MKKIICFFLISFLALPLFSQSLFICYKDGSQDSLDFSEGMYFYFSDPNSAVTQLSEPENAARGVELSPVFSWRSVEGQQYDLLLSHEVDFSDTILFIQNLDTNIYRTSEALESNTDYHWKVRLVGKETWSLARYFTTYAPPLPKKVLSWALQSSSCGVNVLVHDVSQIDSFMVLLSQDGISFTDTAYCDTNYMILAALPHDAYFAKIAAMNISGISPLSEMLFVTTSESLNPALIIQGFERQTSANDGDLILRHAQALYQYETAIASATNDAINDALLNFPNYSMIDYILGEESTADETFSSAEQNVIKDYLRSGGNLFVSGAEIAWDLDNKGSASDKAFCNQFLKICYYQDAPGGQSGQHYSVKGVNEPLFSELGSFSFDNGTHGSYNVKYPDVFSLKNNGKKVLEYPGFSGAAGVVYAGMFPQGQQAGKIMLMGVPFETIYPEAKRFSLMGAFVEFVHFGLPVSDIALPDKHTLLPNFPNPFNPKTVITYQLARDAMLDLCVYDLDGRKIETLINKVQSAGVYELSWDASNHASGVYLVSMKVDSKVIETKKITLLK